MARSRLPANLSVKKGLRRRQPHGASHCLRRLVFGVHMGDQGLDALVSQPRHQHPCCFSGVALALVRRADHPRHLGG